MKNKIILRKEEFHEIIEALNKLELIEFFQGKNDIIGISFNNNKMIEMLNDIGFKLEISKSQFETINTKEAKGLLLILNKYKECGLEKINMDINEIICKLFLIENFYKFSSPMVEENLINIVVDNEIKIILDSLDEIYRVTKEKFTLEYIINDKDNIVELELTEPYKIILNDIRLSE